MGFIVLYLNVVKYNMYKKQDYNIVVLEKLNEHFCYLNVRFYSKLKDTLNKLKTAY